MHYRLNKMFDSQQIFEERNCGERARDGRGLVTASAVWWPFPVGQGRAGTEPPHSPTAAMCGGFVWWQMAGDAP